MPIYHISGSAYQVLSRLFSFPSTACLSQWLEKFELLAGRTKEAVEAICIKVKGMKEIAKDCALCLDEMALKANVFL